MFLMRTSNQHGNAQQLGSTQKKKKRPSTATRTSTLSLRRPQTWQVTTGCTRLPAPCKLLALLWCGIRINKRLKVTRPVVFLVLKRSKSTDDIHHVSKSTQTRMRQNMYSGRIPYWHTRRRHTLSMDARQVQKATAFQIFRQLASEHS